MAPEQTADVIVVGAGLAGLVAAAELLQRGRSVVLVDQESADHLGGQAWWSFGGLFLVDSPEQRRMGIKDSVDLAWRDWRGSAGFDRVADEDSWAIRWARAYVEWAAGEKRAWLHHLGVRFFPVVGWAERGAGTAEGHGNGVPRFHIAWGTGPALVAPFEAVCREAAAEGRLTLAGRHRVTELVTTDGTVIGVRGEVLASDGAARGVRSTRSVVEQFELTAQAVVVSSGGIGHNFDLVREHWPERLGPPPTDEAMLAGVPEFVDGSMLPLVEGAGARLVNRDRMWHYVEGIQNHSPVWGGHGIRILPGPSSLWLDATGERLPAPNYPGFDTLGTLAHLRRTGHDYSWFLLTQSVIEKEFALSGSEQNPDLTGKSIGQVLGRVRPGAPGPVQRFIDDGADFVSADTLEDLVDRMNGLTGDNLLAASRVRDLVEARDAELANEFGKDGQLTALRAARRYRGDRLIRTASPHRFLDVAHGPLHAVRLRVLTRKTLGGVQTDLGSRALGAGGAPLPGLYAAGEAAGFGGGGVHGYRSLEGTFLGGCLFSGRAAARAVHADLG